MTNLQNMKDAAEELDSIRGAMFGNKILLEDISREVAHFSAKANDADPRLAQLFLIEAQSKLRLITTLLLSAEKDMNNDFEQLDKVSSFIFDQAVNGEEVDANKLSAVNRFEKDKGRQPADELELRKYLSDFMAVAEERTKKA